MRLLFLLLLFVFVAASAHAQTPARALVVLNKGEASASLVDAASGRTLARFSTGVGPHEVAISPDGRRAIVTDYGDQQTVGATLTVLDLATRTVEKTIALGNYERPHGIAFLPGGRVAVTAERDSAVAVVDLDAGTVAFAAPTGGAISHMLAAAPDGRYVYTANILSGDVSKVDLAERRVAARAQVGPYTEAVAVRPDGAEVWAASQQTGRVVILDAERLAEQAAFTVEGRPIRIGFTPDGTRALVAAVESSTLYVVDVPSRAVIASVVIPADAAHANAAAQSVPGGASALPIGLVSPDNRTVYVALMGRDQVAVVDLDRLSVTGWIDVGSMPDGIAAVGW